MVHVSQTDATLINTNYAYTATQCEGVEALASGHGCNGIDDNCDMVIDECDEVCGNCLSHSPKRMHLLRSLT